MQEADYICVLDTGSIDKSVELLKENNVHVESMIIDPWRFDTARNKSLELIPKDTDICVCTDLDEVFLPGWREKLEKVWKPTTTRARYNYNWSFDNYGNPSTTFYLDKIHKPGYKWIYPVHEILESPEEEKYVEAPITLNHYPDYKKSRSNYLPLLELSVKEYPLSDRNMHYLGREYMYHHRYQEAIDTLIKHLDLKTSTWEAERCASMRYIARSYLELNRKREAEMWLLLAKKEAPYLREPYVELADFYYSNSKYIESYKLLKEALNIKKKPSIYINEAYAWNSFIYDLMGSICYKLKKYEESLSYYKIASKIDKNNKRLKDNCKILENLLNKNK